MPGGVEVNILKKFIPDLCKECSLFVHHTNHSLRAIAIYERSERKRATYQDLLEAGREAGNRTEILTVKVGSQGMLAPSVQW